MADARRGRAIPGWLVVLGVIMVLGVIVRLIAISSNSPTDAPAASTASAPAIPAIKTDASWPAGRQPTDAQLWAREVRKDYASRLDGKMLDAGIESTTKTSGPGDTTLLITDPLAGRVRAKVIANAMDFEHLKKLGFRKLVYTNGFEDELRTTFHWKVE